MGRCVPLLSGAAKIQGRTRGGECWRWYARGVARHCRPQGAVASNVIVARTPQLAWPAKPSQGRRPWGGCKSDHSQTAGGIIGTAGQAIHQPWLASPRNKACRNHGQPACRTASGPLAAGRAKTTSVIDAITRRAGQRPACRYLSLKFQTILSCSPARYPITTAVQPWCAQESAYRLIYFFFHRIRIIAGPMETPLCKISF